MSSFSQQHPGLVGRCTNYSTILKVINLRPNLIRIETVTVNKQNNGIYVLPVATVSRTAVGFYWKDSKNSRSV